MGPLGVYGKGPVLEGFSAPKREDNEMWMRNANVWAWGNSPFWKDSSHNFHMASQTSESPN